MAAEHPQNTILRFYEENSYYSAVILKDGSVLDMTAGNRKKEYPTVDAWRESLPGNPTMDAIVINEKALTADEPTEKPKKKDTKNTKKPKCNVPPRNSLVTTHLIATHLHGTIKAANPYLLEQANVIDAYNKFVVCLEKYNNIILCRRPYYNEKYTYGIMMDHPLYHPSRLFRRTDYANATMMKEILDDIYTTYTVLHELIKKDIVPYAEKMDHELRIETERTKIIRETKRFNHMRLKYSETYEIHAREYANNMKYVDDAIANLSCNLDKMIAAFQPTKFD
jgi:hypothetical protein